MDWEITKVGQRCAGCEYVFQEEDKLFSVLRDRQTEFVRQDYCQACWREADGGELFSFWRTHVPKKDEPPKRFVDNDVLVNFFSRLEGEEEPLKVNFRYVLALLLIRKKLLTFKTIRRDGDSEWLVLYDRRDERNQEVLNPNLSEEEVCAVTEECGKLLNMRL